MRVKVKRDGTPPTYHVVDIPRKQILLEALQAYRECLQDGLENISFFDAIGIGNERLARIQVLDSMILSEKKKLKGKKNAKAKSN